MTPRSAPPDRVIRWMESLHRAVLRLTGGRVGRRLLGMETVELHTVGRRSGARRSTLLTAPVEEEGRIVLVASKGGADDHPAWYLNLVATPEVEITRRGVTGRYLARTTTGDEREALWPRITRVNPGYAGYQQRTSRQIPVVVCEPRG
ncbi:nitroreductase family deazaflavin-dependent oxidoreductase [Microbacterium sp. ARD31]|uniref:nitroreductase family deazaflavin-dependent oxidoreductase n=1 Tax=unclassified Microbacterium TaxID=2609290 RepID=UPI00203A9083|nr:MULTISPECIES: nitroreductase family deazaflavin-dependent oxidoreductase [unclassified Microbacterium]MDT0180298.1 nitroreductase family deazaflavin-dependent oxidoreductase [Microbacterium sp. ARD31]